MSVRALTPADIAERLAGFADDRIQNFLLDGARAESRRPGALQRACAALVVPYVAAGLVRKTESGAFEATDRLVELFRAPDVGGVEEFDPSFDSFDRLMRETRCGGGSPLRGVAR